LVVKKKTGTKSKTKKSKSKTKKSKNDKTETFSGIVIVDDDLTVNKEAELEESHLIRNTYCYYGEYMS
jgi:ribosomal protein S25